MADVVPVKHVTGHALLEQRGVDGIGEGALASTAEAREPEDGASVTALLGPGFTGHGALVPSDVGGIALAGESAVGGIGR